MIPYKSHLATLVPTTGNTRFEIVKAVNTLAAQDQEQRLRLRWAELASLRSEFEGIARHLDKLCRDWPLLIRSELCKAGFDASEPRVPAGHPDGGQWPGDSGAAAGDTEIVSDAPDGNWIPGAQYAADGHHWVPRAVYAKYPLKPETRKIFEKATSGPLADDSVNRWTMEHRNYNEAVNEAFTAYMKENNINADQMTPEQAQEVLEGVKGSFDPRIRTLRMKILRQSLRYFWIFGPRGGGDED